MALDKISQAAALTGELTEELLDRIGLPTGLCVRRQELCARSLHEVAAGVIQDQEYERVMAPLVATVATGGTPTASGIAKKGPTASGIAKKGPTASRIAKAARKTRRGGRKAAKRTRRQRR